MENRCPANSYAVSAPCDAASRDRYRIAALLATGMTECEIAEEIGIGKSVVHRMKQRIDREAEEAAADHDEGE
jgi:transposase